MTSKRHRADLTLAFGRNTGLRARVAVSSGGLLAIGGLVSAILLSTAALVLAAKPTHDG